MFANDSAYDAQVQASSQQWGVAASLLKGVIAQESAFQADATHYDANVDDTSYGLMQVRYKIAQALGYVGDPTGLFDPATNIDLGAKLLAQNYQRSGDWTVAVAAYNAGWSKARTNDAPRMADGSFVNQAYVDRVQQFQASYAAQDTATPGSDFPIVLAGTTLPTSLVVGLIGTGLALLVWWLKRKR